MTRRPITALRALSTLASVAALGILGGCATVPITQRDLLAQRVMSFDQDERARSLQRVIDKAQYEGVMGGGTTEGSGCGCN